MSDAPLHAGLVVGLCGPAERAEQARLFSACFKKGATAEDLAWRYDRGPHGASISLLARPAGGEGVSGYACSPRRALVHGDEATLATVGQTGDVMTHPDWRKRGIFSDLDRRAMQEAARHGWALTFGLPNRRSAHIFEELGWETVGSVRPWSFYLADDPAARAHALREGRWRALTLGWRVRRCARARARLLVTGLRSQVLARVPPEVIALARQVEPRFGFMVRRDADYLNWRYLENPAGLHEVHGIFDGARLAALVVVQRPRPGERVGYLVDLLAPKLEAQAAALAQGLARLEELGAAVVVASAIDGSWWALTLERAGFEPPKKENQLRVILHAHAADHPLVAAARDTRAWYFTDGDRDDATVG